MAVIVYGSWNKNYLCNQCLSQLMLWARISIKARCTTLCDQICQWLATGRWFSPGPQVSSTNKTDRHDITKILLKVSLNTIKQTYKHTNITFMINCVYIDLLINNLVMIFQHLINRSIHSIHSFIYSIDTLTQMSCGANNTSFSFLFLAQTNTAQKNKML